ncbi:MAG TPA: alanine racemase [Candidatus Dormibacteraeota bacterium]|jgi:alanine racemase|nr:alanine racemase [Candidatus Dormibacteraeota bacterium]
MAEATALGWRLSESRWAEIDLEAIGANLAAIEARLPARTGIMAVVKANGYGHGALQVARTALEAGALGLAVSTPQEAIELHGVCHPKRVLALGGLAPSQAPIAVQAGCAVACHSAELIEALEAVAEARRPVPVHLKVDSGMGRLGCALEEAPDLARRISRSPRLRLAGVFTHFASAEADEAFTRLQFARFQEVLSALTVDPGLRHACNSAAAHRHPEMALDAVRTGISLYGYEGEGVRPALSLRALITQVKTVPAGGTVGYGRTWTAKRPTRVATIAIGYEDGILRSRSNRGWLMIRGRRAPLVGRVSMDQVTADVDGIPDARPGDVATLIGDGISAVEVAEWSDTAVYEVLTSIGTRVRRVYDGRWGA